jgi:hypothetical protein
MNEGVPWRRWGSLLQSLARPADQHPSCPHGREDADPLDEQSLHVQPDRVAKLRTGGRSYTGGATPSIRNAPDGPSVLFRVVSALLP